MGSDSTRAPADGSPDGDAPDGGQEAGFDEARLYAVVRNAVKDALLDVIGTLLLVGIAFVLVVAGGQAAVLASSPTGVAVGVAVAIVGCYVAAATLELVPPVRDWL